MRTIIEAVRLIDGVADAAREDVDVVVDGERITAIVAHGAALPPDPDAETGAAARPASRIDGHGRTLLPGLIDAHAHYTFDPTEGSIATIARRSMRDRPGGGRSCGTGPALGRDDGSWRGLDRNLEVVLRDAIAAGQVPGPRLVVAGTAVGITGGHGHAFGLEADGPDALVSATRRVVRDGADVVKVVASEAAMLTTTGLAPGRLVNGAPELTEAELRAIVETAAGLKVKVMSHAQDAELVRRSAAAGVDSVEHAWLADHAAIEACPLGAFLVPTLVVTDVNRTLLGLTPVQRERQDLIERRHRASTEAAIALGVPIATGTDTGEVGVAADMVAREIALLHDHGATPMAAIRAATSAAARLLGLDDDTGRVGPGYRADLVLVDGDPLADLGRLASPVLVLQAGLVVHRA